MKEAYDVVIIGSGFGGAITGCRLAQAGRSVCLCAGRADCLLDNSWTRDGRG